MEHEETPLLDMLESSPAVGVGCKVRPVATQIPSEGEGEAKRDYSNHEYLLLNEEFLETTEIIMENTFFNIVQETTHQENDFLRVGKKFIQANKL
jgi:hypothetical protein